MPLESLRIKGLVESSLIEWPGKLATVIFLPRCNLRCRYCHAKELILGETSRAESKPVETVLKRLTDMRGWIDGMVISGGEPTLWPALGELAAEVKSRGFSVKIDTNGTYPGVLEHLIDKGLVDMIAMDVKAPLDYRYLEITQTIFGLRRIARSIDVIMRSGVEYEFRTTVVPSLLSPAEVAQIAEVIKGAGRYVLQPFSPHACLDEEMEKLPPCPVSVLQDAARLASGFVGEVVVRG